VLPEVHLPECFGRHDLLREHLALGTTADRLVALDLKHAVPL